MNQLVKTELWPLQAEEIERVSTQEQAILAWEMGTGKTISGLERDLRLREAEPKHKKTLVIAPLNTLDRWMEWVDEECDLRPVRIDRKNRGKFLSTPGDIYFMHPEAVRLMPSLRDFGFTHIIRDECHRFKNRKAAMTKACSKLRPFFKTDMSGSPVTDRPGDFWAILNWMKPHVYRSYWKFYKEMVDYEIKYPEGYYVTLGPSKYWETHGLPGIEPFFSRLRKVDVMPWLPPKTYTRIYVELDDVQRRAYRQMEKEMIAWIGEHENDPVVAPVVIAQLMRLQQFALTYLEFKDGKLVASEPAAKLDAVMELLEDNPNEQMVIFSQFKAPLHLLGRRLDRAGIGWGSFTGDDTERQRADAKRRFIEGNARVLLGTIGAGGVGVDGLQHASCTVVFLDRTWSPAINEQAEDRLHRGGQTRTVQVIDIIARNTVDHGRLQRLELKWEWIKKMLGDK